MKAPVAVFLVFVSISTFSQTRDEIVKSKIESKLKETLPNPSTYEFISLTPSGTITYLHNIYLRTDEIKNQIEYNELDLKLKLQYPDLLHSDADFEKIKSLRVEIDKDYLMLHKIDSVERALGNKVNTPVAYAYIVKCRSKNVSGANVVSQYVVQVSAPNFEVMKIASDTEGVITEFGDFPGYQTLVGKTASMRKRVAGKAQAFADSIRENVKSQPQVVSTRTVSNTDGAQRTSADSLSDNNIYTVVEQQPAFTGGYEALANFIKKNLQYPPNAKSAHVEGTVYVGFVTSKDGSLKDINIVRGLSAECDQEAIRLVKSMPKWTPGRKNGAAVNVRYILPVKFRMG